MWPFKKKEPLTREVQITTAVVCFETLEGETFKSYLIVPSLYPYAGNKEKGPRLGTIETSVENFLEDIERNGFYRNGNRVYPKERIKVGEIVSKTETRTFVWGDGGWHWHKQQN